MNTAILTAGYLIFFMLLSALTFILMKSDGINKILSHSSIVSSYLQFSNSYNTVISKKASSSFVPAAYSSLFTNDSKKITRTDNSADTHERFYDDFEGGTYTLNDGEISPNGKWRAIYTGHGSMGVAKTTTSTTLGTTNNYFFEQPRPSIYFSDTSASLVTTTKAYSDFQMTLQMKTVKQLRQNSAPNPWETGWIFWHYTDDFHYYALVLKTNGFQIEKKDNNNRDDSAEIYVKDLSYPKVKIGQWQTITIQHENSSSGTPHIQVWVDGVKAADFIDNKSQPNSPVMSSGSIGLYNEDSRVNFDNVNINSIP
jgi:hypothetical protein